MPLDRVEQAIDLLKQFTKAAFASTDQVEMARHLSELLALEATMKRSEKEDYLCEMVAQITGKDAEDIAIEHDIVSLSDAELENTIKTIKTHFVQSESNRLMVSKISETMGGLAAISYMEQATKTRQTLATVLLSSARQPKSRLQ